MIIYIHGFGGSGNGSKAKVFREYFKSIGEDFIAPSLPYNPKLAIDTLEELVKSYKGEVYLIGSSLGGFYASWLSSMCEVKKVVLINPATKPYQTLKRALGDAPNFYDNTTFSWNDEHIKILEKLETGEFDNSKFMVLLQKGDELLDYKDALKKYDGCRVEVEDGGSHSFYGVERHFENIRRFFAVGDYFKHTQIIKGVGLSNKEVADRVGDLYYDNMAEFLKHLSDKLHVDAIADEKRGRKKLANHLKNGSKQIQKAQTEIQNAWDICAIPTMKWMEENGCNKS